MMPGFIMKKEYVLIRKKYKRTIRSFMTKANILRPNWWRFSWNIRLFLYGILLTTRTNDAGCFAGRWSYWWKYACLDHWLEYRNIILHDSIYPCEQLLEFVYPELAKQNSWKLPVWYYISKSSIKSELAEEKAPRLYSEIVTESTIKRNCSAIGERTAWEVWTQDFKFFR